MKSLDLYKNDVLSIFVCSSVGRGDSDAHSDIDLHFIYKDTLRDFKMYATLEEGIAVDWVWEPYEHYNDFEEIMCHFSKPHNIKNSIILYDPHGWFGELKNQVIPDLEKKDYVLRRVKLLWENKSRSLEQAIQTDQFGDFIRSFMQYRTIALIPLAACTLDPSARKLLIQAKRSLELLGANSDAGMFELLFGCRGITKNEALHFSTRMMETYDYCIKVQTADYHGINPPKRDYHYNGIKQLIEEGFHKEAIHPILEWISLADYRITQDTGRTGWWTSYKDELYNRLGLSPEGMNVKKEFMLDTHNLLKKYCNVRGFN
ncbi:hypothetical protein PDUR_08890 [Paenibacillus durus]|uniref:Polymerase nucleotidyl transferase domain-containing protein n=2 Tax=Paenibacillus durus TaxID=44251 RepID=A0A089ISN6_PAEDU|nr:hypothetical protein PDUR_08890 [Paenibacillus durus]